MIAIAQVTFGNNDDTHGRGSSKMAYRLYTVGLQALHRWLIIIFALSRSRSLAYLFFGSRNALGPAGGKSISSSLTSLTNLQSLDLA